MNALIVDDEADKRMELLQQLAQHCPAVKVLDTADNADEAVNKIKVLAPDLIFLDIRMPGKTGFDMLADLATAGIHSFGVIITSGFDEYALQAIKLSCIDFLVKPVIPLELISAVDKAIRWKELNQSARQVRNLLDILSESNHTKHLIALPLSKEIVYVSPDEIVCCEGKGAYTKVHLDSGLHYLISKNIKEYEETLEVYGFFRVHQSFVVNRRFVRSLKRSDNVHELVLRDKSTIPVSRLKVEMLRLFLAAK